MAKGAQVNIRFEERDDAELEETAERLGLSKSALVRHLTRQFLNEVRRTGSLQINPTWISAMGAADGRSAWGDRKLRVAEDPSASAADVPPATPAPPAASAAKVKYPKPARAPKKSDR